ncbi:MAG: tRNA pseudouridine(55) synthase TruB [Bacillota bacterium]|nr:tRNA pseudouridine(55) synthase TruB [Bacillota bacterium]
MEKQVSGVLNIFKPKGITSNGVIMKVRKIIGIKKVGHTGTLDPEAEGVLPICIGKATRVAGMLTDANKAYRAVIRLGITTDSQDMTGKILSTADVNITKQQFEAAVSDFVGEITQVPPMYSAIKMNGQPLYKLARQGIEVERKPREIKITEIKILDFSGDKGTIEVYCSKGTYIRTLCADIGEKLGCGGVMDSLLRIKSGPFELAESITIEYLSENINRIDEFIVNVDKLFDYDSFYVKEDETVKIKNGVPVRNPAVQNGKKYRVYGENGEFLCISEGKNGVLEMIKGFY